MEYPINHETKKLDKLFVDGGYEKTLTVAVTASEAVSRGCLVKYDTSTKKVVPLKAKTDEVFGVVAEDIESGKEGYVYLNGEFNKAALTIGTPTDGATVDDFFLSARKVNIILREVK